jgi:hypothetical protein
VTSDHLPPSTAEDETDWSCIAICTIDLLGMYRTTSPVYRISIVIKYEDGLFPSGVMFIPNYWIKILTFVAHLLQGDERMDMKP